MTYYPVYDSNTNSDFNPTAGPVSAGAILVNGLTDVFGGVYTTGGGTLTGKTDSTNVGSQYQYDFLFRPVIEDATDCRTILTIPSGGLAADQWLTVLRGNRLTGASTLGVLCQVTGGGVFQFLYYGPGGVTAFGSGGAGQFTYNTLHVYTVDFSVTGNNYTSILTDVTSSTVLATITGTYTGRASGSYGLVVSGPSAGVSYGVATRFQTFTANPSIILGTTSGIASHSYTFNIQGIGTSWTSGTTATTSAGSIVTNSVNVSAQTMNVTLTTPSTSQVLTIGDTTDALTASFAILTGVTDPGFWFSPAFAIVSGQAIAPNTGPYGYLWFTGTSVSLMLSTANIGANAAYLAWSIDGGPITSTNIQGLSSVVIGTGLSNSLHKVWFAYKGRPILVDQFGSSGVLPVSALVVIGAMLSSGATTTAPTIRPNLVMVMGDSRPEGVDNIGGAGTAASMDATFTTGVLLARELNAEYWPKCYGGTGWVTASVDNALALFIPGNTAASGWNQNYYGVAVPSTGGVWNVQPTHLFVLNMGVNDRNHSPLSDITASVQGALAAFRTAMPATKIYIGNGSYDGYCATQVTSGFNAYQSATPDPSTKLLQYGLTAAEISMILITNTNPTAHSFDGIHPDEFFHSIVFGNLITQVTGPQANYAY